MRYLVVLLLVAGCAAAAPDMSDVEAAGIAEAKAYSAVLTQRMDRGEITEVEARLLYQQKINDLSDRYERTLRARSAPPRGQSVTNCRPDGYGGTRCVTR